MYDLLVIGGGITGAGAARDAALRGMSVCLVDADDIAFGTSSRSSKLVHGGLRYLEQGELGLVFESVSERRVLGAVAPHLVTPRTFLFPVYDDSRVGLWKLDAGMWLYDALSLFRSPRMHRTLGVAGVAAEEPTLRRAGLRGAPVYYDCATDDARLTLENAMDAAAHGAVVRTHARVVGFVRAPDGTVRGVRLRSTLGGGAEEVVEARVVLNATGPWTDRVRGLDAPEAPILRPTRGVHLVVDSARLGPHHALIAFHPRDGRVLFVIPWGTQTYVGTTDTDDAGDPSEVRATAADVAYLLDAANHYYPDAGLVPDDVISTWAGLRPLLAGDGSESSVSREHAVLVGPDGLLTIAGGKLTTYRRMAREVVDRAVGLLHAAGDARLLRAPPTETLPLPGGVGWPGGGIAAVVAQVRAAGGPTMDDATADVFAHTYGVRAIGIAARMAADPGAAERLTPDRPERVVQVDVAVAEELAHRVADVLVRRTQVYYRAPDQGLAAAPRVAARMAARLGWDAARVDEEVAHYAAEVARSRLWRES
jgi:glycerol-3-phosphate dehydrogenase